MELPFGRNRAAALEALGAFALQPEARTLLDWLFDRAWPDYADGKPAGPQPVHVRRSDLPQQLGLSDRQAFRGLRALCSSGLLLKQRLSRGLLLSINWRGVFCPETLEQERPRISDTDRIERRGETKTHGTPQRTTSKQRSTSNQLLVSRSLLVRIVELLADLCRETLGGTSIDVPHDLADVLDQTFEACSNTAPKCSNTVIEQVFEHSQQESVVVDVVSSSVFENKDLQQEQQQSSWSERAPESCSNGVIERVFEHSDRTSEQPRDRTPVWQESIPNDRLRLNSAEYCQALFERLQRQGWVSPEEWDDWQGFWAYVRRLPNTFDKIGGFVAKRIMEGTWREIAPHWTHVAATESATRQAPETPPPRAGPSLEETFGDMLDSLSESERRELADRQEPFVRRLYAQQGLTAATRGFLLRGLKLEMDSRDAEEKP